MKKRTTILIAAALTIVLALALAGFTYARSFIMHTPPPSDYRVTVMTQNMYPAYCVSRWIVGRRRALPSN